MSNNLSTRRILSYDDVAQHSAGDSDEQLVDVVLYDNSIITQYIKTDMVAITGNTIYVRDTIAKKLARIEASLREKGYGLKIVYGYRHPRIQREYFKSRKNNLALRYPELTGAALDRYTHNYVAVPEIAGHPAGAAVDLTLVDSNKLEVNMGTAIADYTDETKIRTFASSLTPEQTENRKLLHDVMINENFAPFYGEWWHFSYGDREWAAFYDKKALYGTVSFQIE